MSDNTCNIVNCLVQKVNKQKKQICDLKKCDNNSDCKYSSDLICSDSTDFINFILNHVKLLKNVSHNVILNDNQVFKIIGNFVFLSKFMDNQVKTITINLKRNNISIHTKNIVFPENTYPGFDTIIPIYIPYVDDPGKGNYEQR